MRHKYNTGHKNGSINLRQQMAIQSAMQHQQQICLTCHMKRAHREKTPANSTMPPTNTRL
jgi:hypothetical protein